jgi:AAA15 family ATPase/GTPase
MKLESLKLTNFRGFREFEITFDPQFTVLLGGNMAGKSAVLDATAFVLRRLSSGGVPLLQPRFPVMIEAKLADGDFHRGTIVWHFSRQAVERSTSFDQAHLSLQQRHAP